MKVSLIVATGAHYGKVIPITGPQFLIGRDAQCHLRPASQAISKRHCGVLIRDGKVYVRDYGSTNGTVVNDETIQDAEVLVESGASLKIGPLDFTVQVEKTAIHPDGTPLPSSPETAAALAAVTAAAGTAPKSPSRDNTPNRAAKHGQNGVDRSVNLMVEQATTRLTELEAVASELRLDAEHWRDRAEQEALARARAEGKLEAFERAHAAEISAKDTLAVELRALLADARRPWWRRWVGA